MRKIIFTLFSVVALAALTACGGSSNSTPATSAPSGGNNAGFSNSSLKGTYVFSDNGVNSNAVSFAVVGVFTADGAGNISSGTEDYFDDSGNQVQNQTIDGTYSVNTDGRGQLNISGSSTGAAVYRFIMQSPSAASFFQFSTSADTTGRIQLQSPVNGSVLGGLSTFVVRFDGEDTGKNIYGAVGAMTINSTSITGTMDQNDFGVLTTLASMTGSDVAPSTNGRGTLSISFAGVTHNFVYYWVSPSHIELVSSDGNFWLHGYADLQATTPAFTTSALSGGQVLALSGSNSSGPLIENARFTLDGIGGINSGVEDYNQDGAFTSSTVPFIGTYSVTANGRWTAPIGALASNLIGWQVSSSQSVVLTWNSTNSIAETGTMREQAASISSITNAGVTGNYAENLSGYSFTDSGFVETTANLLADGAGNLAGTLDSQTPATSTLTSR